MVELIEISRSFVGWACGVEGSEWTNEMVVGVVWLWWLCGSSSCSLPVLCVCVLCRAWKSERVLMRDFFFSKKKKDCTIFYFFSLSPMCIMVGPFMFSLRFHFGRPNLVLLPSPWFFLSFCNNWPMCCTECVVEFLYSPLSGSRLLSPLHLSVFHLCLLLPLHLCFSFSP